MDDRTLSIDELAGVFQAPWKTAWRVEFLPAYDVPTDRTEAGVSDFERWKAGAPAPDPARKGAVLDALREEVERGQITSRVKVMSAGRTTYERYAAAFGYAYNQEFEHIRIFDLAVHRQLPAAAESLPDFWILDRRRVLLMRYDDAGHFEGALWASPEQASQCRRAWLTLSAGSVMFDRWWAAHPELHRQGRVA